MVGLVKKKGKVEKGNFIMISNIKSKISNLIDRSNYLGPYP